MTNQRKPAKPSICEKQQKASSITSRFTVYHQPKLKCLTRHLQSSPSSHRPKSHPLRAHTCCRSFRRTSSSDETRTPCTTQCIHGWCHYTLLIKFMITKKIYLHSTSRNARITDYLHYCTENGKQKCRHEFGKFTPICNVLKTTKNYSNFMGSPQQP